MDKLNIGKIATSKLSCSRGLPFTVFLWLQEYVHCDSCKLNTHQHTYTQYFFNVMSQSIGLQQMASETQNAPIGVLLKEIEDQNYKTCDIDKGDVMLQCMGLLLKS